MISLVSPKYNFRDFCLAMFGKDPLQVMDAASAEITYARLIHREKTKDRDFRRGSRGRAYRDDLQQLISLFMGSASDKVSPQFVDAVRPLALHLLQKWEILGLRQLLSRSTEPTLKMELCEIADFLTVVISREQIEAGDISAPLQVLSRLIESPKTAKQFADSVDIAFHGYDDVAQELFEMPAVRSFVFKLDEKFPYWLFFLSKHHPGLKCVMLCFLPPYLTEIARAEVFPTRIGELLTRHWFPAMNHMCRYAGFSEHEVNVLTDRALAYVTHGRLPLPLSPLANQAKEHWKEFLPKMYAGLVEKGTLDSQAEWAAKRHREDLQAAVENGYSQAGAAELVNPRYVFLPSEQETRENQQRVRQQNPDSQYEELTNPETTTELLPPTNLDEAAQSNPSPFNSSPWVSQAKEHWKKYCPKLYAEL
jgi:hypothetical protein